MLSPDKQKSFLAEYEKGPARGWYETRFSDGWADVFVYVSLSRYVIKPPVLLQGVSSHDPYHTLRGLNTDKAFREFEA